MGLFAAVRMVCVYNKIVDVVSQVVNPVPLGSQEPPANEHANLFV